MKRGLVFITIIFAAAILLIHVNSVHAGQTTKTLKIGCTLPLNVALGLETKKCLDVIIPDFNSKGGLLVGGEKYKIEMIIYDDGYKPNKGRAAVERLIHKDKVKFLVGQLASPAIVAGLAVTEQNGIMVFCGGASPKIVSPKNKLTFRASTAGTFDPGFKAAILKRHPEIKTSVSIGPDDETGRAKARYDNKICKSLGIKKIESLFFPRETEDYTSIGLKVASLNPDMVYIVGATAGTQPGGILKALSQAGYKGVKVVTTADIDVVSSIAGKEAVEGLYVLFADSTLTPNPTPSAKQLKALYQSKYGSWNQIGMSWVGPWYLFIEAVKAADSLEVGKIMASLEKIKKYDAPRGYFTLVKRPDKGSNRYCDSVTEIHIGQVQSGKLNYLFSLSPEEVITACEKVFGGGSWR